jgi:hypothetical protein
LRRQQGGSQEVGQGKGSPEQKTHSVAKVSLQILEMQVRQLR